ncbi:hypothetical protein [Bifidobacterium biavatii]|uniref:Phage protein n=1 Tax=Bifidobacterium biavatii DSM 23969 TaxID=1437608 RepID=A0A086ZU14_9BIFI|nr:hypothetical protein [Bifidobacterium biavatii]KFI50014.1 phage protein [Bifidobacterium biavatii DSM 23969]
MADPEQVVCQWLADDPNLADWHVSLDVPAKRPDRLITVERTGGDETRFVAHAMLAIQIWAPTRNEAMDTARQIVLPRLHDVNQLDEAGALSVNSVYNFPDPGPPMRPRCQIVAQITTET